MNKLNLGIGMLVLYFTIVFVTLGGYIANIAKLVSMDGGITTLFILRVVGIFAVPFGAILGLFV